ncbi:MAG: carboxypeptidase-like regulatory domain-containing protein [Bacteroidota bacterium]|jgi:hypothetical protein|nr:carboxypeptidase-like regulatory domain-containing protein [Cytophagales bacterium]MCE2957639.1 carboxypeptidase-like regulatory domain-containing protein [Flammeovirgaceae bacterium]MCZ8070990.1 carboxypeptidase-like regulatory domain-containing protein [Cytophagales bacterium]
MKLIFLLIAAVCTISSVAQNKISGTLKDEKTGEPIAFANVFFSNTTFGSSTNDKGEYSFSGFPSGKYDLTFAFVGYTTLQVPVSFEGNTHLIVKQTLAPEAKLLSEILVKPDTAGWARNFRDFTYHLLGNSQYAKKCVIKNPKDVSLYFDKHEAVLVAHAKKPIVIENFATGYRINYYLYFFEFQARTGIFNIYGFPQFEEMAAKNERVKKNWAKTRQRIYEGSLLHFMRSWRNGNWQENDFTVSRLYRIPNPKRPSDQFLNEKIKSLRGRSGSKLMFSFSSSEKPKVVNGDSLAYFIQLRSLPKEVDSVAKEKLTGKEFDANGDGGKNFKGLLTVKYDRLEEPEYAATVGRPDQRIKRQSLLHVLQPINIYDNGYYEDVKSIFLEKYWSWSEKISTLLPLDYVSQPD